jgi:segregation and condensation protein A
MDGASLTPAADGPLWDDWERPPRLPMMPVLHLEGFDGPMDLLLDLAERQRIDFGRMSILALAEQFVAAMAQFEDHVAIERRADWLVIVTRLVLLRSRLLFPESPMAAEAAERDAATELRRIDDLAEVRAAAAWLGDQPVLGQDVFARGAPEQLGEHLGTGHEVDVIAFLWASLSLFEDEAEPLETVAVYRPLWTDLHTVAEARDRILRILGEGGDGQPLQHFLPEQPSVADEREATEYPFHRYSAWATTFSASLELAKQAEAALAQAEVLGDIRISRLTAKSPT